MRIVGLIGLDDDKVQVNNGQLRPEDIKRFRDLLEEACKALAAQAIAEELCEEWVRERKGTDSVCREEARRMGLKHRYCDPNTAKRNELGIRNRTDIYHEIQLERGEQTPPREIVETAYRIGDERREKYWLEELRLLDIWPVIFVCGAYHTESFRKLLEDEGFTCKVYTSRWSFK